MKKVLLVVTIGILFLSMFSMLPSVPVVTAQQSYMTIPHQNHMIVESIDDPQTVDPAWAYDTASGLLIMNVYETLITFDREHTDQFVPVLSRNVPTMEILDPPVTDPDTGIVWNARMTFHIRLTDGPDNTVGNPILFHSGNPLTMGDVEYSFERWLVQDRSGGPEWMIYEPVEGIGYYHAFDYTEDPVVQGMIIDHAFQVSGDDFIINMAVAYAPILGILAQFWASIVDKAYITANVWDDWDGVWGDYTEWVDHHDPAASPLDSAGNLMSGTGPYAGPGPYTNPSPPPIGGVGYWTHGVEWSIVKFEDYWRGWDPSTSTTNSDFLYRVTERVVYEWSTRLSDFRAGTADIAYVPRQYQEQVRGWPGIRGLPETPPGSPWGLPALSADGMFYTEAIDPASPYVGTGTLDGNGIPLDFFHDLHIRKAFAYLFDAETFLREVWLGEAIQPSSPVIPGIPYSIEVPKYQYSLTKAAEEFQAASADPTSPAYQVWDKGFYFKMPYNTGNQPRQVTCEMLRTNLAAVNSKFRIDAVGVTWSTYQGELWWYPSFKSVMPMFVMGWQADYPDAHNWVFSFMHTDGEFSAPSSYSNPTVDALIEEGISTPDGPARAAIYAELQQLYYEEVPSIMIAQPLGRHWERDWVQGWYYNPVYGGSTQAASLSLPPFYSMWEGLNGDVNNDGTVNFLDLALLNYYWWDPPELIGPAGHYEVKYDIGPYLQYQIDSLPPPGFSVGKIDVMDMAVVYANWGAGLEPPDPPGPTMLLADTIDAPGMGIGETFSVNIYVSDVEAMWGFQFKLAYDTSVLTATEWAPYYPFNSVFYSNIDDTQGYVSVGCLMQPPELVGWYWEGQYPLAWIEFRVDAVGASPLNIKNSVIADIYGNGIPHTVTNGWFRNLDGSPIAYFSWTPWSAQAGQSVTFTSLSFDPEGTIAALDWNWGDGTPHGTMETETHAWATYGTYTVTLTVTDNEGITDSQARSIVITEPPLAGAIATTGKATHEILDFTKKGSSKQALQAWAKNLDKTRQTFVKVEMDIWSSIGGYLGTMRSDPMWIAPLKQGQFKSEFDMMDPKWGFVGGRSTSVEYTVYVEVYYADYFIGGDPNNPHWAQVPNPPEDVWFTFTCKESAPVPVLVYTYDATTGTVHFDGSKCTDPDIKHGDYIAEYRWQIYENGVGQVGQVFGLKPSFTLPEDGQYRFRLRVEDMFGVRNQTAWTAYVYFDVP